MRTTNRFHHVSSGVAFLSGTDRQDPDNTYDRHNLIFDIPWEGMPRTQRILRRNSNRNLGIVDPLDLGRKMTGTTASVVSDRSPIFSIVRHYPMEGQRQLLEESTVDVETSRGHAAAAPRTVLKGSF